ncbi:MAG: hypothetical protein IJP62_09260 [Treponema sp.]|nr:hypothetical protein [Treponema sp.]
MLKFFFKKNFCDGWDNLFFIMVSNIGVIALLAGFGFLIRLAGSVNVLSMFGVIVLATGVLMSFVFAWGANARKIADFNSPSVQLFFRSLKESWRTGFLFGLMLGLFAVVCVVAISYYLSMAFSGSTIGLFFCMLITVFALVCVMAMQWFVPLYFLQEENDFRKCFKKSFIIFFDNAAFSFAMLIYNLVLLAISFIAFFLIPGINGITLSNMNALRLRLYKYDWLEEHPDYMNNRDKRADVPWDDLLADDKESLGPRKFTSFIFPWK